MEVSFENLSLTVREDAQHEWVLETELVADGYGVKPANIRKHKMNRTFELIEGKHYVTVTSGNGGEPKTMWTKKGVVRLGFFIKSDRARKFRDWAEDLIVGKMESKVASPSEMLLQTAQILVQQEQQLNALAQESQQQSQRISQIEAKLDAPLQYYTIMGWAILNKQGVPIKKAAELGKKARKMCNDRGIPFDTVPDPRFGRVGSYPAEVLQELFAQL